MPPLQTIEMVVAENFARRDEGILAVLGEVVGLHDPSAEQFLQSIRPLVEENPLLVLEIALEPLDFLGFDLKRPGVLVDTLAREHLGSYDRAGDTRRAAQGRVLDVSGLVAEDRPQQLLLGSQLHVTFRHDLADQNVVRADRGTDTDDSAVVEIPEETLRDVRNVAGDLFRPELRLAGVHVELLDMQGGVVVVLDQLLADEDRVLEVVPAPRHERHQHVASQRQLAICRAGAVRQDSAFLDPLANMHDRLLVDAGVLVRPAEFHELIDVRSHLARELLFVPGVFDAHDDALRIHGVDDPGALAEHHRTRVAGGDPLHAGAHHRRLSPQQRNRLTLHVRAHQGAVRVVVLEERNQARRDRHQLLRAHVQVLDLGALLELEVARHAAVSQFPGDVAVLVNRDVGLGNDVLVLLPSREVRTVSLEFCPFLAGAERGVGLHGFVATHHIIALQGRIPPVHDTHLVDDAPVLDFAIGTLDEAVLVDAGEA